MIGKLTFGLMLLLLACCTKKDGYDTFFLSMNGHYTPQAMACWINSGCVGGSVQIRRIGEDFRQSTDLELLKSLQFPVDIIIPMIISETATVQIGKLFAAIEPSLYNRIWVDVNTQIGRPTCALIMQIATAIVLRGKSVGIRSDQAVWSGLYGFNGCPDPAAKYPLWNIGIQTVPFGGWTFINRQTDSTVLKCLAEIGNPYRELGGPAGWDS